MSSLRSMVVAAVATATVLLPAVSGAGTSSTALVRPVEPFVAVALRAPFDLVLRQGTQEAVQVQAAESLQPLVETVVVDGIRGRTLEIRLRRDARLPPWATVVVTVDVASLRALTLSGAGDARGSGLRSERLDVSISGSGDLELSDLQADALVMRIAGSGDARLAGRATTFTASIAGSGDLDAETLQARDVSLRVTGSGDALLGSVETLDVAIAGSGDVSYRGDARLSQRIAGSGSVSRR